MLAVWDNPVRVDRELVNGGLACPSCGGQLGPWGWARLRDVRAKTPRRLRPRRSRCRACRGTHVLVPTSTLLRRRDAIEVIGAALLANCAGQGHRRSAAELGVPPSTLRGWLRRFAAQAEDLRSAATAWAHRLDASHPPIQPRGSPRADALEALGLAAAAAIRRFGPRCSTWHVIAALTGGLMLAPRPLPRP